MLIERAACGWQAKGEDAVRIAVAGLQERGFADCAEAFTFFDSAGEDGGGFLSHVELELGFRNLRLVEPAHKALAAEKEARAAEGIPPAEGLYEDHEDPNDETNRELLILKELSFALEAGALRAGQTSYSEFLRALDWTPLRWKRTEEQNAALDDAMIRRKSIRAGVTQEIQEEEDARQVVLDARKAAARESRQLVAQAKVAASEGDDEAKLQCAATMHTAMAKIVPEAAVMHHVPAAAVLYDHALDAMLEIGATLLAQDEAIVGHVLAQTAESKLEQTEDATKSLKSAERVFSVARAVPKACALVCAMDADPAEEGSKEAEKLPATPENLVAVSKLSLWKLVTRPGAGLLRQRLTRQYITAAGEMVVAIAERAEARAAACATREGQEPAKELAVQAWEVALEVDPTNVKAVESLPAAKVVWAEVLELRKRLVSLAQADTRANDWIDSSGMSDYGFFG